MRLQAVVMRETDRSVPCRLAHEIYSELPPIEKEIEPFITAKRLANTAMVTIE